MTYQEILAIERQDHPNTIRLFKNGKFLRAYGRSAWLFHTFIRDHEVTRFRLKDGTESCFIGFPSENLLAKIGERTLTNRIQYFEVSLLPEETDIVAEDNMPYGEWAEKYAVERQSKGDYNSLPKAGADAEKEVIRRIRTCDIENMTMHSALNFVWELRQLLKNK